MAKKVDPLKAKQKKQKIMAGVLGVLFLGLVAFQFPRVMKHLNQKPAVAATATTTASTGTPSLAAPTLAGSEQATSSAPGGSSLTSGDVPPPAQDGQLASFSRFASKDPFAQQLGDETTGGSSSGPGPSSGGGSTPSSSGGGSPSSSGGLQSPGPGSAVISVNGTLMTVSVGTDFPQATASDPAAQPLFHLISVTAHSAKISIVGGSYSNGTHAVTLRENRPLTLMNTADGARYKLVLKAQGTPVPSESSGGTSTSPTTTVTLPPASP
jgi:hypothetical protein